MENNHFKKTVEITPDICDGYCNGLQALKANAAKVVANEPRKLEGSVDIDACTLELYPAEPRWDYVIGYEDHAYFLEVHPANTSNVNEMIRKADWLKQWLKQKAPALKRLAANDTLYWIPSGKYAIRPGSPQYRKLAQSRILLVSLLHLPVKA